MHLVGRNSQTETHIGQFKTTCQKRHRIQSGASFLIQWLPLHYSILKRRPRLRLGSPPPSPGSRARNLRRVARLTRQRRADKAFEAALRGVGVVMVGVEIDLKDRNEVPEFKLQSLTKR